MANIPTPHINCDNKNLIAKTVLMPGDPLRAKYIADMFLTDVYEFTSTRNVLGYTGKYNGKEISVMASGMGMPSIGIYSYELFNFYDVDRIIRVGSCGSYDKDYKVYDTILVSSAYSDSNYAKIGFGINNKVAKPSSNLNSLIKRKAKKLKINLKTGKIYSSDIFYSAFADKWKDIHTKKKCVGVEMESFALFTNANVLGKEAACILTVSDSFVLNEAISSKDRETNFNEMIKLALELA